MISLYDRVENIGKKDKKLAFSPFPTVFSNAFFLKVVIPFPHNNTFWRPWETSLSPFPTVFSTCLDNLLPFSSNLELSSANSFSLERV